MLSRREFVTSSVAAAVAARVGAAAQDTRPIQRKGRLKQSVCRWCYGGIPLDELCRAAADVGFRSVELLGENEWHVPRKYGLTCAMPNGPGNISDGWNRIENHERLVQETERLLPRIHDAGLPNMIVMSGNRRGISDEDGIRNCVTGLKRVLPLAEKLHVTLCLELLNSKVDHKDYHCDRTAFGVGVVQAASSERLKLLYDIYHMQIMEGDVIRTIRENIQWIGHFHTGGVPGRGEIDDTQELNYSAICRAIADSGFQGFVAQEFVPTGQPLVSLRKAFEICDV